MICFNVLYVYPFTRFVKQKRRPFNYVFFFILEEIQSNNGVGITSIRFYEGTNSDDISDTDTFYIDNH